MCKATPLHIRGNDCIAIRQMSEYVKDRRYIRQKAGRIIHAHRLWGLRRLVLARYAALRAWGGGKIRIQFLQTQFARFEAVETDKSAGEIGHQRIAAFLRHFVDGDVAVVEEQELRFRHPHPGQIRLRRE